MKQYLAFLYEQKIEEKQSDLLRRKFHASSQTSIGREIGVSENSKIGDLPLTSYLFYQKFFEKPVEGAFIYPISEYLRIMTSGSMGIPKWYLIPHPYYRENSVTMTPFLLLCTHDGKKVTYEKGDALFALWAPRPFATGFLWDVYKSELGDLFRFLPVDQSLAFPEKSVLFIQKHDDIAIASIPLPILFDEIYPRIGKPLHLKGFISADASAHPLKQRIREMIGTYPVSMYASTETALAVVPSPEHYMGLIFDWRTILWELIPADKAVTREFSKEDGSNVRPLSEAKVGERYQVVATPFNNDFVRYVMMDLMQCVASGDSILGCNLPVFRFISRVGGVISLHNFTRIDEGEILDALSRVAAKFHDFTARREIHGPREYLTIYLETEKAESPEELKTAIHEQLMRIDQDYANLSRMYRYIPLRVETLAKGTFASYLGQKVGIAKQVERLGMTDENFKKLIAISNQLRNSG